MSWSSYRAPRIPLEAVKSIGIDDEFIRALNEQDFSALLTVHGDAVEAVYGAVVNGSGDFSFEEAAANPASIIRFLVIEAPSIVVDIIALAADAKPEDKVGIASIPLGVKLNALREILEFTKKSDPDLGKFLAILRAWMAARSAQDRPEPSPIG